MSQGHRDKTNTDDLKIAPGDRPERKLNRACIMEMKQLACGYLYFILAPLIGGHTTSWK